MNEPEPDQPAHDETPGFADAMAELEQILAELEGDEVDVDVLAARVRRASDLIAACRERIVAVELEVTQIVADLDGPTDGG